MSENTNIEIQSAPTTLIAMAIEKNVDVSTIEKLMDLQERWEAKEAKKSFFDALSKFQADVKEIKKSKLVDFGVGKAKYKYAQLSDIDEAIKGSLAKYGLSKTFHIEEIQEGSIRRIHVTCKISHLAGHSETTTMSGGADATGNKNSIQASGSTITYLQRYTLIGALGLTTADEDNDAVATIEDAKTTPAKPKSTLGQKQFGKDLTIEQYLKAVQDQKTLEGLQEIWSKNPSFQKKKVAVDAVNKKKEALTNIQPDELTPVEKDLREEMLKINDIDALEVFYEDKDIGHSRLVNIYNKRHDELEKKPVE